MSDNLDGLSEYLGIFSDIGSVPTSLQGYGHSSARHMAELRGLGAQAAQSDDPAGPRPSTDTIKFGMKRWSDLRAMLVKDVQWGLNQLGYKAGSSKVIDKATQNAYAQYTKLFTQNNGQAYDPVFLPAKGGFDSEHWVWANTVALADLGARAKIAASKGGSAPAANTSQKTTPAPAQKSAGNFVTSVASAQDILVRLGWKSKGKTTGALSKDMTDGLFGSTLVANWQSSAQKRKLDAKISRDSGTTVLVNQATFLALKQLADQAVPPAVNQPVVPAPSGTTTITEARLNEVLARMAGAPAGAVQPYDRLVVDYQARAKAGGLDTSISKDQKGGIVVSSKTWDAFVAAFNTLPAPKPAPTPAPTPAQKSDTDKAMDAIAKAATTSLPVTTLTKFFNAAIAAGSLKHDVFKSDAWTDEHAKLIVDMRNVTGAVKTAWEQMLVKGKLVAKDLKSVLLPKTDVDNIKKVVADYEAAAKKAASAPKDFTKVATDKIIGYVNDLHVTSKKFKTNGGATEMSDALRTFLDLTKTKAPSTIVWGDDKTGIYVQNGVLEALNKATDANKSNSTKTQQFRDKIVSEAIKASTADVTFDDLQLSFIETVSAKKAGKNEKLYAKVKQTNAFDSATRDAYTVLARALIIGPAFDQYQQMLKQQMGTSFTAKFAEQEYNKIWDEYLEKAREVSPGVRKIYLHTFPKLAEQITAAAKTRRDREGSQKVAADETVQAKKDLAAAVAKSTSILAVIDAQLGLLWAIEKKSTKFAKGIKATGIADAALGNGMKDFSKAVFDRDPIPDKLWAEYLEATGIKATNKGDVAFGWTAANFIAVPVATATTLSKAASSWMTKHGVPDGYNGMTSINPINQATLARFTKPTVVRVTVPKKKDDSKPDDKTKVVDFDKDDEKKKKAAAKKKASDEQKKLEAEAKKLKDQIAKDKAATKKAQAEAKKKRAEAEAAKKRAAEDKANKAAQDAAAKAEADARAAEAAAAQQAADVARKEAEAKAAEAAAQQKAADVASQAQGGAGGSGGDVNLTINTPPAPAPDTGVPQPFVPAPPAPLPDVPLPLAPDVPVTPSPAPEPVQAGMMSPGSLLLMSAVGLGILFFHKDDKGKQDNQQQTGYSRKRGGRK